MTEISSSDWTYKFNYLPFGLACASWVFTKLLKPIVAQLRQLGIRLIIYIDNILIMAESPQLAKKHARALAYLREIWGSSSSGAQLPKMYPGTHSICGFWVHSDLNWLGTPSTLREGEKDYPET